MATAEVPQEAVVEGSIDEVIDLTTSPISVPPAPQYTSQGYRPPRIQKPPMHDRTTDRHYYVPPLTLPRNTNINDHIDDLEIMFVYFNHTFIVLLIIFLDTDAY